MATLEPGASDTNAWSLRPVGWGRYIDVVFLGVWILGWAVGEVVGLALFGGLLAVQVAGVFGTALSFAPRLAPDGSAPFFLLGLLVWLTLWTVGGVGALTHFLRSLAGQDRVAVSSTGLEIERRAGPFRRQRTIPHSALRRIRLREAMLVADTAGGTVDVTNFGTRGDREALLAWLRERLMLPDEPEVRRLDAETVPPGWEVEVHGMETRLTRPTRRTRAMQAAILWTLAGLVSTGSLSARYADSLTGAHIAAGVLGLLIALWATWTTWGRSEWLVRPGRLTLRRRFGSWQREQPQDDATLELLHSIDSDGDDRFTLRVRSATARRTISTALYDPAELTRLAEWLSARTRFPIERPAA